MGGTNCLPAKGYFAIIADLLASPRSALVVVDACDCGRVFYTSETVIFFPSAQHTQPHPRQA